MMKPCRIFSNDQVYEPLLTGEAVEDPMHLLRIRSLEAQEDEDR
jgi:hypothetical protein